MSGQSMRFTFAAFLICIVAGCSDTTKFQSEFRGTWNLESRKTPQGDEIKAPEISGQIEWFPISKDKAHIMMTQTHERNAIQVLDGVYTLQKSSFTFEPYVRIGGKLGAPVENSYETKVPKEQGTITSEDARATLIHADGTRFEFIGAQLSIIYTNGTSDHWKRQKDQKGALAN